MPSAIVEVACPDKRHSADELITLPVLIAQPELHHH